MKDEAKKTFSGLAAKYRTPRHVQDLLRRLDYNREKDGDTLRSALSAWNAKSAHCLEACFVAAAILEHHGYPPLVMSLESMDNLDHVVFVFQSKNRWGAVGRSRMEGLHGREPVFKSLRDLADSYFDPFIDATGKITAYALANLDHAGGLWRSSSKNVWHVERHLIDLEHRPFRAPRERYEKWFSHFKKTGESGKPKKTWW